MIERFHTGGGKFDPREGDGTKGHINNRARWEEVSEDLGGPLMEHFIAEDLSKINVDIKDAKILELGSGSGNVLDYLRGQGLDVVGLDARPRSNNNSSLVAGLIEQMPFPNECFDYAFSLSVFSDDVYIQDQSLMLAEISRVLKHGGIYHGIGHISSRENIMPATLKRISGIDEENSNQVIYQKI